MVSGMSTRTHASNLREENQLEATQRGIEWRRWRVSIDLSPRRACTFDDARKLRVVLGISFRQDCGPEHMLETLTSTIPVDL